MKTLVIPDIHLKIDRAQRIINYEGADKVIFLGDIFDDFNDTSAQNAKAAEWLNDFVDKPNHVWCVGNHDTHHITRFNNSLLCIGFEREKQKEILEALRKDILDKVKYYHFSDGVLFSHGGLHNSYIPEHASNIYGEINLEDVLWLLDSESKCADKVLQGISNRHWFFEAGYCRGGKAPFGGLTWCDFYREFLHINGLCQIVGHSSRQQPHIKIDGEFAAIPCEDRPYEIDGSWSLGLDTHLNYYATIENKQLTIKKYSDL